MAEDLERAQNRLANIRGINPLLGALRTISLGSWQAGLKRKVAVTRYREHLMSRLPSLLPYLHPGKRREHLMSRLQSLLPYLQPGKRGLGRKLPSVSKIAFLVIGSERGLCGRFNTVIAEHAEQYLVKQKTDGIQVELWALGSRVIRIFRNRQRTPVWSNVLSATSLPPYRLACDLAHRWLLSYQGGDLDAVDVLYNVYLGAGRYKPTVVRLIPPQIPPTGRPSHHEPWPPPIIETDPWSLIIRIVEQASAISIYECLLDSAVAEHSARYQLMEEAVTNTKRLIDELTMEVQMARRQLITREMQELAVGAGLIGPQ